MATSHHLAGGTETRRHKIRQDPHQTERSHSQERKQTTKRGGTEEPTRFLKELVDKPTAAVTSRDIGDVEGEVILAPIPSPAGEATQGDKPPKDSAGTQNEGGTKRAHAVNTAGPGYAPRSNSTNRAAARQEATTNGEGAAETKAPPRHRRRGSKPDELITGGHLDAALAGDSSQEATHRWKGHHREPYPNGITRLPDLQL